MDAPHSLLDERELSSAIADAMIEQVLSILQRLRPFIAYEVQQRLKSHSAEVPAMRRQISPMQRQHSPFQTLTGLAPSSLAGPLQEKIPLPRWMGDGGGGWKSRAGSVDSAHSLSQGEKGENAHAWEQSVEKIEKVLEERSSNTPKKLPKALSGMSGCFPILEERTTAKQLQCQSEDLQAMAALHLTESVGRNSRHGSKSGDRSQSKMSQFSSTSGVIENRAKMKAARKAAMTLDDRHHVLPGLKEFVGEGLIPDAPPEPSRTPKRKISVSMTRAVSGATRKPNAEFKQLPKTVSGAWRRQALSLAEEMRKDMAEEVAMAKTNMSFRRGLWWLRHLVGLRSMNRPYKAMLISFCLMAVIVMAEAIGLHGQIELHERTATAEMNHPFFRHVRNYGLVVSAGFGLLTHHFGVKFSDVGLPSGEQDQLLQAHSVGMGYVQPWIFVSKRNSRFLGSAWMASMLFGAASEIYKTRLYPGTSAIQVVSGSVVFISCASVVCALCMRIIHICSAMKTSLIRYMQNLAQDDIDFEGMAQEWNTIQIFIRCLCDGCSYSMLSMVLVIPVMGAGAVVNLLYTDSISEVVSTMLPFIAVSCMPLICLLTAADLTQQCEQAPQVANSMLVLDWDNERAQDLLNFMSRCQLGFFVNDMRVSPAAVTKFIYILVAACFTILSWSLERILVEL